MLGTALQFAPWNDLRLDMAQQRIRWHDRTRPFWAKPLLLAADRGDDRKNAEGVWPTNKRAWEMLLEDPLVSHCWVWQEDMEPCMNFWRGISHAITAAPDEIIVMLCDRQGIGDAIADGRSWLRLPDGTWGGATLMPRTEAEDFLAWEAQYVRPELTSADARVDLWMRSTGRTAIATAPSLLQHTGHRSIMGHSGVRKSRWLAKDGDKVAFGDADFAPVSPKALNRRMFDYLTEDTNA